MSPFVLGPVNLYGGYVSKNVENGWQHTKVFAQFDDNGKPSQQYFEWAQRGWNDSRAYRYPMGKGAKPLYSWWDGEKLDYISARKQIYIPLYVRAASVSSAWRQLETLYASGDEFVLWDFDGYDTDKSYEDLVNDPSRPLGHGFVLAAMLEHGTDLNSDWWKKIFRI